MASRLIYFFLGLLVCFQLRGQDRDQMNRVRDSLNRGMKAMIADKKVKEACRKKINQFEKIFGKEIKDNSKETELKQLVKNTEKVISFFHARENKECVGKHSADLVKMGSRLIALSKKTTATSRLTDSAVRKTDSVAIPPAAMMAKADSTPVQTTQPLTDTLEANKPDSPSGNVDDAALSNKVTILSIVSAVLAITLIILALVCARLSRNLKSAAKKMDEPKEILPVGATPAPEVDGSVVNEAAIIEPEAIVPEVKPVPPPWQAYLVCEVMMTAGPRKKFMGEDNADKDLGEDVCGFVSKHDEVLFWLLDGTSDLHCLKNPANKREYFSSRLLAVGIAEQLRLSFLSSSGELPINEMVTQAIAAVRLDWLKDFEKLPDEEKQVLRVNIEKKNFPECAATLLISCLRINGDLVAYRSGDSKMFLFKNGEAHALELVESSLTDKNDASNDRIFFRLRLDEQGRFDIICNEPLHEIVNQSTIKSIICLSDGVGKETEKLLIEGYKKDPEKTRNEIVYQSQETGDDKSIVFVGIRNR